MAPTSEDGRRHALLKLASHCVGLALAEDKLNSEQLEGVSRFLDGGSGALVVCRPQGRKAVLLTNDITKIDMSGKSPSRCIVFYKVGTDPITTENFDTTVQSMTLADGPLRTLYHCVQQVYSPALAKSGDSELQLQKLFSDLQATLGGQMGMKDNVIGITSIIDEHQYWKHIANTQSKHPSAAKYAELLEPVATSWSQNFSNSETDSQQKVDTEDNLEDSFSLNFEQCLEALDNVQDGLDELWLQDDAEPYPEDRMARLLDVAANGLVSWLQANLDSVDLWSGQNADAAINGAISTADQWLAACATLTGRTWRRSPVHPWQGASFEPKFLTAFRARLVEISAVQRATHQLAAMSGESADARTQCVNAAKSAFRGFNLVHYNPLTEAAFNARMAQFDTTIQPLVRQSLPKLREKFRVKSGDSEQTIRQFSRYRDLLKRNVVKQELATERQLLLSQLSDSMQQQAVNFQSKTTKGNIPMCREMSEIGSVIMWTKQQEARIQDALKLGDMMLSDLSEYESVSKNGRELLTTMTSYRQQQFDTWCRDTLAALDDPKNPIGLQTRGKLLHLEQKRQGFLVVNCSDRLIALLREVRQLSSLGHNVPHKILAAASEGDKFYGHIIALKQVAHFYNTIDQQMLPCHKPMLLDAAVAFEKLIKNETPASGSSTTPSGAMAVTWENPKQLEAFIDKLQVASDRLTAQNRKLRTWHDAIMEKVVNLMSLDLHKHQQKWKDNLNEIRQIFKDAESQGFNAVNMKPWKAHWDRQLYKALEHQYQLGIETLHHQIPEIKVQLFFRQQRLQLQPPMEEIRAKYYREMKKFLSIPSKFKGVSEIAPENNIFIGMIDRNSHRFDSLYKTAEMLFAKVDTMQAQFKEWVALGKVDMDTLIEETFTSVSDWENGLKMVKAKGREAERLPMEYKIDCINVSTAPVKSSIDSLLQRLFDALLYTLRQSIQNDLHKVSTFSNEAIESLNNKPQSIDEIAAMNTKHHELSKSKTEMKSQLKQAQEKNNLLRSVAGNGVDSFSTVDQSWDQFDLMLDGHQMLIKEQVEVLKTNFSTQVSEFNSETERFAARWHQLKPKSDTLEADRASMVKAIELIKEKRLEFDELQKQAQKMMLV